MPESALLTKFCNNQPGIIQTAACACICLVLCLSGGTATAGPEQDLGVAFHGDRSLPPPGGIAGTVTNRSAQYYRCVDLVFRLIYKGAAGGPAEKRIRVRHLPPRSVKNYSASLQAKAGFRLQRIETCASGPGETPPTPSHEQDYCTIRGSVTSTLGFQGVDDTGHSGRIERVFLLTSDGKLVSEAPLSKRTNHIRDHRSGQTYDARKFFFTRIPSNRNYIVKLSHAWKTLPSRIRAHCPDSQGRYEFKIAPIKHIGNRLGG